MSGDLLAALAAAPAAGLTVGELAERTGRLRVSTFAELVRLERVGQVRVAGGTGTGQRWAPVLAERSQEEPAS